MRTRSAFVPALESPRAEGCNAHSAALHRRGAYDTVLSMLQFHVVCCCCCAPYEVSQDRLHTIFYNRRIDQLHLRVLSNFFAELAGVRKLPVARD